MIQFETSKLPTVVSILTLIDAFNPNDVNIFKQVLWKELDVASEKEFVCKFLQMTLNHPLLSSTTLTTLHNESNKIYSESQYPSLEYSDPLSSLSNGVIQHILNYLSTKDQIAIRHINRRLFMESQNIVHYSDIRGITFDIDEEMAINCNTFDDIWNWNNLQLHPSALTRKYTLRIESVPEKDKLLATINNKIKKGVFDQFFQNANRLVLYRGSHSILPYIPLDVLFGININTMRKDNYKDNMSLKRFEIEFDEYSTDEITYLTRFCDNYLQFFQNKCQADFKKIKSIDTLFLSLSQADSLDFDIDTEDDNDDDDVSVYCKKLSLIFKALTNHFVSVEHSGIIIINDIETLCNLFHKNVKSLWCDSTANICVTQSLKQKWKKLKKFCKSKKAKSKDNQNETTKAKLQLYNRLTNCNNSTKYNNINNTNCGLKHFACCCYSEDYGELGQSTIFEFITQSNINIFNNLIRFEIDSSDSEEVEPYMNFLKANMMKKNVLSNLKVIKFDVVEDYIYHRFGTDNHWLYGKSRFYLQQIMTFDRQTLLKSKNFEYFCIQWLVLNTRGEDEKYVTDDSLMRWSDRIEDKQIYDVNLDRIYVSTDLSTNSIANIHFNVTKWIEKQTQKYAGEAIEDSVSISSESETNEDKMFGKCHYGLVQLVLSVT